MRDELYIKSMEDKGTKRIYFAGGCFWGTEHFMKMIEGVLDTTVGYANGNTENPTYEEVCKDNTGFAEAVEVTYNPERITLSELIRLFFKTIDPTSLNRQGGDIGEQYRSGIYYIEEDDESVIQEELNKLRKKYKKAIVTEALPLKNFYRAENYHQDYLYKYPNGYCHIPYSLFEKARSYKPKKKT